MRKNAENAFLIRKARRGDIASVYEIEKQSFKDPYPPLLLSNLLGHYPNGFLVAENETGIIGYVIFRILGQKGHIISLAVNKGTRYSGVGTQLLFRAMKIFETMSAHGVWLEVRISNKLAQRFYLKRGFKIVKVVKGYYGEGEDALILYRPLSS